MGKLYLQIFWEDQWKDILYALIQWACIVYSSSWKISVKGAIAPVSLQSLAVLASSAYVGPYVAFATLVFHAFVCSLSSHPSFRWTPARLRPYSTKTLGYIFGFVPAGVLIGSLYVQEGNMVSCLMWNLGLMTVGHCVILICGVVWLRFCGVPDVFGVAVSPFLPGLVLKSLVGALLICAWPRGFYNNDSSA